MFALSKVISTPSSHFIPDPRKSGKPVKRRLGFSWVNRVLNLEFERYNACMNYIHHREFRRSLERGSKKDRGSKKRESEIKRKKRQRREKLKKHRFTISCLNGKKIEGKK